MATPTRESSSTVSSMVRVSSAGLMAPFTRVNSAAMKSLDSAVTNGLMVQLLKEMSKMV